VDSGYIKLKGRVLPGTSNSRYESFERLEFAASHIQGEGTPTEGWAITEVVVSCFFAIDRLDDSGQRGLWVFLSSILGHHNIRNGQFVVL
jgi:hypothetical protein